VYQPVNFVWFERKVKEWGCMQALIDFDGWRKWKDAAVQNGLKDASNPRPAVPKKKLPEPAKTEPAKTEPGPDEKPSSAVTTGPSLEGLKGSRIEDQIIKEESPDTVIAMG
jgi:osomolarity two-component system response regulator SSK1